MIFRFIPLVALVAVAGCTSQPPAPTVDRSTTSAARPVTPAAVPGGPGYYTVKRGDTLYRIALENGQDYRDIAAWNNITNPSAIREGQVLRVVPPGATTPAAPGAVVAQPIVTAPTVETRSLDAPRAAAPAVAAAASGNLVREPRGGKEPYSDEAYARLSKAGEQPARPPVAVDPKPEPKTEAPVAKSSETKPEPPAAPAGPDDVAWMWPSSGKIVGQYSESGNKGLDFAGRAGDPVLASADGKVVYAGSGLRGYGELVIVKHNATFLSAYAHNRKILVQEGQQVTRGQKIAEMGSTDSDGVKLHFEIRRQGKPVDPLQYLPRR